MKTRILLITLLFVPWAHAEDLTVYQNCRVSVWKDIRGGKRSPIIDGDTIYCFTPDQVMHKIRLRGLDTPEIKFGPVQCYGNEARDYADSQIYGKNVKVVVDGKDDFKRELGFIYYGDQSLNLNLVATGHARAVMKYKFDYVSPWLFFYAQELAKKEKFGLWGACENR